jgi:hypothetical protein
VGEITEGELLEQNKKGTWKVREVKSRETGAIQNSKIMPGEMKAGEVVKLKVKINKPGSCAFDWVGGDS